jgi:predicted nucleotidyltransferase component of viral defense system
MISTDEVQGLSIQLGVPLPYVEKDYVMGWLLWGIYQTPSLAQNFVLKGGNCLRKIYFPDTRFSDDLDFTALHLNTEDRA